ncbi:hypothetical protein RB653_002480 [Dictyostelium firmibasis]|uniref:Nas2 N-terminal domain-containing protein n=1 Tax=Dictyostelium firmibasis TaxID=79012 RepID=A0AAN7YVN2_9MYCE
MTDINNKNNDSDDSITIIEDEAAIIKRLMVTRNDLEKELESLMNFLKSGDGKTFGLKGSFTDSEGYPSPHLELIIEVKKARSRIAHIQNDYKQVMKDIEFHLGKLHKPQTTNNNQSSTFSINNTTTTKNNDKKNDDDDDNEMKIDKSSTNTLEIKPIKVDIEEKVGLPFVYIDLVSEGSPSDKANLKKGDLIFQFGTVGPFYEERHVGDNLNSTHLQSIATIVRNSENKAIPIKLSRGTSTISTSLIPRKWSGQGLIGCLIKPI